MVFKFFRTRSESAQHYNCHHSMAGRKLRLASAPTHYYHDARGHSTVIGPGPNLNHGIRAACDALNAAAAMSTPQAAAASLLLLSAAASEW